jgi:hypothetical protein
MKTIEQILEQDKYSVFKDVTKYIGICSYMYANWGSWAPYIPKDLNIPLRNFIKSTDLVDKHSAISNHYTKFVFVNKENNDEHFLCTRDSYVANFASYFPSLGKPIKPKFVGELQKLFQELIQESLHLCETTTKTDYDCNSYTPKLTYSSTLERVPIEIISILSFLLFIRLGLSGYKVEASIVLPKEKKVDPSLVKFDYPTVNFGGDTHKYTSNLTMSDHYARKFYVPHQFDQKVINEMRATVLDHLKHIPDVKILSLSPIYLNYTPYGGFDKITSILNPKNRYKHSGTHIVDNNYNNYSISTEEQFEDLKKRYAQKEFEILFYYHSPVIYSGFAWQIQLEIEGNKMMGSNEFIYFTDYTSFENCYRNNPELEELVLKFKDRGLVFISSSWCQRTGSQTYSAGVDMQGPLTKNQTLMEWIITSLIPKKMSTGTNFTFTKTTNGSSQVARCKQLEKILTFNKSN